MDNQTLKAKEEAFSRKEILDRVEKQMSACEEESWLEDYNREADRVSKHIRYFNASSERDRKVNAIRYQAPSSLVKETLFVRRWSAVSGAAPEFLVYNEMICTNRLYIYEVTSMKSEWLVKHAGSLCKYSAL